MAKPTRRISKQNSSLDARQRALLDEQQKIAAETHRLELMISQAPKLRAEIERQREEQERRRREEILQRTRPYLDRFDDDLYRSKRINATTATGKRHKPTRAEHRAEILRFVALTIVAIIVGIVVYMKFIAS